MPITEIALLHLSTGTTPTDPELRSNLLKAKNVMQNYTGHTFYYMQQLEDPAYMYVIGEWDTLDQHIKDFIPSADNQAVLESLKDKLSVEWLEHIDVAHAELPLPTTAALLEQARHGEGALIWSIARHFVKSDSKPDFSATFEQNKQFLLDFVTEGVVGGGWRVDKEEQGKEEFVLFSLWKSREEHGEFAKTESFQKYAQIRAHIDGADIKHATLLDI